MIKLKTLLKEVEPRMNWSKPPEGWKIPFNAPDELVDVIHRLVYSIMKNEDNPILSQWIKITHNKNGFWNIDNPRKHSISLSYYPPNKQWYYFDKKRIVLPATNEIISNIIDDWSSNSNI